MDFSAEKTGQRIKELRAEKGLTQKELANLIGGAQNTIAQYEKGLAKPSVDVVVKLVQIFNVTSDYLLGITDYPSSPL